MVGHRPLGLRRERRGLEDGVLARRATSPSRRATTVRRSSSRSTPGYADLEAALAAHGSLADGFVNYSELTEADKRELTDLINALAEPLSQLTVTVLE